jgi:hypothetical protein
MTQTPKWSAALRDSRSPHDGELSRGARLTALAVLVLLCFQLSRVYLVVPTDEFVCSIPGHSHGSESVGDHHHDDDGEFQLTSLAGQEDGRTYIQHCKDTVDGSGLTPAQPFAAASTVRLYQAQAVSQVLDNYTSAPLETFLPTPLQPPRS